LVVRLARAIEEANGAHPLLLTLEGKFEEVVGSSLTPGPDPPLIYGRAFRCVRHCSDEIWVAMSEGSGRVTRVDDASSVGQLEPDAVRADYLDAAEAEAAGEHWEVSMRGGGPDR
jgi:hypothetical protein